MRIRYVLGSIAWPKEPRRLKSGQLSTDKAQQVMAWQYKAACLADALEMDAETFAAFQERDKAAWGYRLDIWSSSKRQEYALHDAAKLSAQMKVCKGTPPRNPWNCDRCDWQPVCEDAPSGVHVLDSPQVKAARPPTAVAVKYNPRVIHWLNRDKPGRVVSPSELRTWATCQRKWWFEYARRLGIDKSWKGYRSRARGILAHGVAELLLLNWDQHREQYQQPSWRVGADMAGHVDDLGQQFGSELAPTLERIKDEAGPDFSQIDLDEDLRCCLRAGWDMVALAMEGIKEVVEVEQRRLLKLDGSNRWISGKPDAILRDMNGAPVVLELKTTASSSLAAMAERYRSNPAVDLYAAMYNQGQPAQQKKETSQ